MERHTPNDRPYRSHLRPACLPCRKRKSRCQSEASSETCLMCRAHRTDCVFPSGPSGTPGARHRRQTRSLGASARSSTVPPSTTDASVLEQSGSGPETNSLVNQVSVPISNTPVGAAQGSSRNREWPPHQDTQQDESPLALGSNDEQQHNLHIVGPAVTSDNQVLSDYLSAMPSATRGSRMVIPVPGNRSRPVLFTMVQKQPLGLDSNRSLPAEKLQVVEKVLEPFMADLLDV